jgi:hypothetical protein
VGDHGLPHDRERVAGAAPSRPSASSEGSPHRAALADWYAAKPIGRQARHRMDGKDGFVRDFAAVFHNQNRKQVSFMDVDAVKRSA